MGQKCLLLNRLLCLSCTYTRAMQDADRVTPVSLVFHTRWLSNSPKPHYNNHSLLGPYIIEEIKAKRHAFYLNFLPSAHLLEYPPGPFLVLYFLLVV